MESKKRLVLLFLLMSMLFHFNSVDAALGLTPALVETDFEPNLKFLINFNVLSVSPEQKLRVYADGDVSQYVKFDKTELTGSESFTAYVSLPDKIEKPGKNRLYIRAQEVVSDKSGIATRVEVGALIIVKVPYPGKYAEIKSFNADDANENEPVNFAIEVENLGEENITASAEVKVYSGENFIESFSLGSKEIGTKTSDIFEKKVEKGYKSGVYNASAIVSYERTIMAGKIFRIGNLFVNLSNWSSDFLKGKINEFNVEIESRWNNDIKNVYAEVNVTKNEVQMDYFKTPSVELKKWEKKVLKGFFNCEDLEAGKYKANIILFYEDKKSENIVELTVSNPPLLASLSGGILIAIVSGVFVFLLLVIAIVYLFLKRNKNGKKKK